MERSFSWVNLLKMEVLNEKAFAILTSDMPEPAAARATISLSVIDLNPLPEIISCATASSLQTLPLNIVILDVYLSFFIN
jgi:hypothetical protein